MRRCRISKIHVGVGCSRRVDIDSSSAGARHHGVNCREENIIQEVPAPTLAWCSSRTTEVVVYSGDTASGVLSSVT